MRGDKWHLTDSEITKLWRNAEDRHAEIKILAELNNKTRLQVVEKLRSLGMDVPETLLKKRIYYTPAEDAKIWRLRRRDGLPYKQIARMVGKAKYAVVQVRYEEMRKEYIASIPTLEKALQAYVDKLCTDPVEREQILLMMRRGL